MDLSRLCLALCLIIILTSSQSVLASNACLAFGSQTRLEYVQSVSNWIAREAPRLKIKTVEASSEPTTPAIEVLGQHKTLTWSRAFIESASHDQLVNWVKKLLVGTSLHPHAPGDGPIIFRPIQEQAYQAALGAQRMGQRKFLYVAPTATGKTPVLVKVLDQRLAMRSRGLHILIADKVHVVNQLRRSLENQLQTPHALEVWGGEEKSRSLRELVAEAKQAEKPLILVTTIQSLKARFLDEYRTFADSAEIDDLIEVLETVGYDEAHHTGAEQAYALLTLLMEARGSRVFLMGTTATPPRRQNPIEKLFGSHGFWAYIDTAETYLNGSSSTIHRSYDQILDQLSAAIDAGDITPFDQFHLLLARNMLNKESVFINTPRTDDPESTTTRYRVDPKYYAEILKELIPNIAKHRRGFFAVGTTKEADEIASYLQRIAPAGRRIAALHSRLEEGSEAVEKAFRKSEIDYLVAVRQLDEAMDYPDLSFYADLNRSVGMTQLLQRIGRLLRLSENKDNVDIAMLMDINSVDAREALMFFQRLHAGKFSGKGRRTNTERFDGKRTAFGQISKSLVETMVELRRFWRERQNFMSEDQFRDWMKLNNVQSAGDFRRRFGKREIRPANVPSEPPVFYGKPWADFTGNTVPAPRQSRYFSKTEFIDWAKANSVRSANDFRERFKAANRPPGIPAAPHDFYGLKWSEITANTQPDVSTYLTETEFRDWLETNRIQSSNDFNVRFKLAETRPRVPSAPSVYYGRSWPKLLNGLKSRKARVQFAPKSEFLAWALENEVATEADYQKRFVDTGLLPSEFSKYPAKFYSDFHWSELSGRRRNKKVSKVDFLRWARAENVAGPNDFKRRFGALSNRPKNIPAAPDVFYGLSWAEIRDAIQKP